MTRTKLRELALRNGVQTFGWDVLDWTEYEAMVRGDDKALAAIMYLVELRDRALERKDCVVEEHG